MQDSLVKYYPKGGDFIRDHRLDLAMMQTQEVPFRMEMLRIFQVAAVFFGILMEKISRVKTAGRKMIGRGQAWYAAAWADWRCETGYGSVRSVEDAGTGYNGVAASGTAVYRNRWGYARRGRKTVTDKVDVGNNPRDGNVCWKYLSRELSRCKLRGKMHSDGADLAVCCSSHIRTPYADT